MGASWKTSIVGWFLIASGVLGFIGDTIASKGIPSTLQEWFVFGMAIAAGIGAVLSKDHNVSNSGTNAPAHPVE